MFLMLAIIFISYVINGYNYKIIAKYMRINLVCFLKQHDWQEASLIGTPAAYFAKIDFIMGALYSHIIE